MRIKLLVTISFLIMGLFVTAQKKNNKIPGITKEQRAKIKPIRKEKQSKIKPLREKRKTKAEALRSLMQSDGDISAINTAIDELTAVNNEIQKTNAKFHKDMMAVLTPEQVTFYKANKIHAPFGNRKNKK